MKKFLSVFMFVVLIVMCNVVCVAYSMEVGETVTLYADEASTSYAPVGNVSRTYIWSTSNSSIVEIVAKNGSACTVRAKAPGTAIIGNKQSMSYSSYDSILGTMSRWEEGFGGSWTITVDPLDPTGISIPSTLSVEAEDSKTLTPTFTPSNASSSLTWKSSDTSVATVSDGKVYGKYPGTATITVTTENGYSDKCTVTVTAPQTFLSVVNPTDNKVNVSKDTTIKFTYNKSIIGSTAYSSIKLYDNTAKKSVSISSKTDGKNLIITPSSPLLQGHSYTATVPKNAVENYYAVKNTVESTTTFKIAPLCVEDSTLVDGAMDVNVDTDIAITFDGIIEQGSNWNNITLCDGNGVSVTFDKKVLDSTLVIIPESDLNYYTKYILTVPKGAVACGKVDSENDTVLTFKTIRNADVVYPPEYTFENGRLTIIAEENTSIYYTINGGVPIISGIFYTEPIVFDTENIHVRAIAVRNGRVSKETEYKESNVNTLPPTTFGGSYGESFSSVTVTEDGYIAVGSAYADSFGTGDWTGVSGKGGKDAIIVKFDKSGNVIWKKNFGGSRDEYFNTVAATEDGYIVVGYAYADSIGTGDWTGVSGKGVYDAIIVKFDTNGKVVWKKNFGGKGECWTYFYSVTATADGYVAVGEANNFGTGDLTGISSKGGSDAIIVKFDTNGKVVWKKNFGGSSEDVFRSVTATEDGCIAVGYSFSLGFGSGDWTGVSGKGFFDVMIVKYNTSGNVVWKKSFGGSNYDYFESVTATEDGFIAVGYSYPSSFETGDWTGVSGKGGNDAIIVKFDKSGNVIWKKNFGGSDYDIFLSVTATEDGCIAVGYSYPSSFETGDWTGVSGKGNNDAIIVKYDKNGNVVLKKNFGGSDNDSFGAVAVTADGCVTAGYSSSSSFETGDWTGVNGKGNNDAIIVKPLVMSCESDRYIVPQSGKVAVSGNESVVKGDEITVPVYFTPSVETTGVNIKLTYPDGISYIEGNSDYESVYYESNPGSITISGDFSADDSHLFAGEVCVIARLIFKVDSFLAEGDYAISIDEEETFIVDSKYEMNVFAYMEDYNFTVSAVSPKAIGLTGSTEVTKETQYKVVVFPENAVIKGLEWSVSDESIALIDQNGLLTPKKNGEITLNVKETSSGLETSVNVVVSELQTYISEITSDTGDFAKEYVQSETERILYVPKGTDSIKLTVNFDAGSVSGANGLFFKKVAKTLTINSLPCEFTLTKKESGYEDTVYAIKVMEMPVSELIPEITINDDDMIINVTAKTYEDANIIIAVYDDKTLEYVKTISCDEFETKELMGMKQTGDKLKIMLVKKGNIKPLCNTYEVIY